MPVRWARLVSFAGCAGPGRPVGRWSRSWSRGPLLLLALSLVGAGSLGAHPQYYALVQELPARHMGVLSGVLAATSWVAVGYMQGAMGDYIKRDRIVRLAARSSPAWPRSPDSSLWPSGSTCRPARVGENGERFRRSIAVIDRIVRRQWTIRRHGTRIISRACAVNETIRLPLRRREHDPTRRRRADAVERAAAGDVQRLAVLAAEGAVGHLVRRHRQERQQLPSGSRT